MLPRAIFAMLTVLVVWPFVESNGGQKRYTLQILELLPKTGNLPTTGDDCQLASETLVNYVNHYRPDILPDYFLEVVPADEGGDGMMAVSRTIGFLQGQSTDASDATHMSPAMIAGYYSAGCKGLGSMLHEIGMTAFSISCSAAALLDRRRYKNLYLTRAVGAKLAQAHLQFIRKIGKWKKIAILTYVGSLNDFAAGDFLNTIAWQSNVSVVWFDGVFDLKSPDHAMSSLKSSGARIVVFWATQIDLVRQFLCLAYKYGMTGNRFMFILPGTMLTDLSSLPETVLPGCTKTVLLLQYTISVGAGQPQIPFEKKNKSYLGYDANEFEVMFDNFTNSSRRIDYPYRYQCHDATLDAIMSLDLAEKAMRASGLNITLRDFQRWPLVVGKFVNDSASQLDYAGLRIGRIKYTSKGELATDFVTLTYWGSGQLKYLAVVRQLDNTTGQSNDDYYVDTIAPMTWATKDGQPPRDSSPQILEHVVVPKSVTTTVLSMASAVFIWLLACIYRHRISLGRTLGFEKLIALSACLGLLTTSVLFSTETNQILLLTHFRIVTLVLSLSALNGMLFNKLYGYRSISAKRAGSSSSHHTKGQSFGSPAFSRQRPASARESSSGSLDQPISGKMRTSLLASVIFLLANVCVVTSWLVIDPLRCKNVHSQLFYDETKDNDVVMLTTLCFSANQIGWMFALAAQHMTVLAACCFFAFDLRHQSAHRGISDFTTTSLATANSLILSGATILILIVLESQPVNQNIVISFSSLTLASSFSYFVFNSAWRRT